MVIRKVRIRGMRGQVGNDYEKETGEILLMLEISQVWW